MYPAASCPRWTACMLTDCLTDFPWQQLSAHPQCSPPLRWAPPPPAPAALRQPQPAPYHWAPGKCKWSGPAGSWLWTSWPSWGSWGRKTWPGLGQQTTGAAAGRCHQRCHWLQRQKKTLSLTVITVTRIKWWLLWSKNSHKSCGFRLTCKHMDIILQAGYHVLLLDWCDTSTRVNHHHLQPTETLCTLDGRAAGVSWCTWWRKPQVGWLRPSLLSSLTLCSIFVLLTSSLECECAC